MVQRGDVSLAATRNGLRGETITQHHGTTKDPRRSKRYRTSRRICRSRERTAAFIALCALGRRRRGQRAAESKKRVRVFGYVIIGTYPARWTRFLGGAETQGGIRLGSWLNPKAYVRDPWDEQSPGAAMRRSRRIQPREGHGVREGVRRSGGRKAPKGKPHERDRDEISSAGREGSKASKGCETPRAQLNP